MNSWSDKVRRSVQSVWKISGPSTSSNSFQVLNTREGLATSYEHASGYLMLDADE